MMDMQLRARFLFLLSAMLAGVIVALAGLFSLCVPIWSIVRKITTAPVRMVFSHKMIRLPDPATLDITKKELASGKLALRAHDFITTRCARHLYVPTVPAWCLFTAKIERAIFSSAFMRTTSGSSTSGIKLFPTNRTDLWFPTNLRSIAICPMNFSPFSSTFLAAKMNVLGELTRINIEFFSALCTLYNWALGRLPSMITCPVTKSLWFICDPDLKFFSALFAYCRNTFQLWSAHNTDLPFYKIALLYQGLCKMSNARSAHAWIA